MRSALLALVLGVVTLAACQTDPAPAAETPAAGPSAADAPTAPSFPDSLAVADTGTAGTYTADLPAASSPGRTVVLALGEAGTAELRTDDRTGERPAVTRGTWSDEGDDRVLVDFGDGSFVLFQASADSLVAVEYDRAAYGAAGLRLARQR